MRASVLVALVACIVSACGVGSSETVEEIEPGELAALDQTSTTSTTTTTVPPAETVSESSLAADTVAPVSGPVESSPATTGGPPTELVELYFVNGSEIVPVDTPVATPVAERRILDALGFGPPPAAFEAGVRTTVPPGLVVRLRKTPSRALVTVDLDGDLFHGIDQPNQRYVVAQIVLTLTTRPDIDNVLFTVDGEPLSVFQREDELTEPGEPVTRDDYEELLAGTASGG